MISAQVRDGLIDVGDASLGFRAYVPDTFDVVVVHFHGNAEVHINMSFMTYMQVAGDADQLAPTFHAAGACLLSVDYRGYGWSTGAPAIKKLTVDAEKVIDALIAGSVAGIPVGCKIIVYATSVRL